MAENLYVIGIDGGGTKTTAVLCAADGKILAESQGGASNFQTTGAEHCIGTLLVLIETCCRSIGCSFQQIGAVAAGLAGAGRPEDRRLIAEELAAVASRKGLPLNRIVVESDARIALEGAFRGKPGIIVISGTGSIVFGMDDRGKTYRAGGWGRLISDEGSGYSIGREAFKAVMKSMDGVGQKTGLTKVFGSRYGLGSEESVINALYRGNFDIASVVPAVIDAASGGDKVARDILLSASKELVDLAAVVSKKMYSGRKGRSKRLLAMTGSLLSGSNFYSRMVRARIRRMIPFVSVKEPESSPVMGAVSIALKNSGE
jgi:N-acetylglucosamine kinase-like BadF-type ATPase